MEQLYQENAKIVYHYLLSLCRSPSLAEDLTQETFLRAYQSLERYDGSCRLSTWLCQIGKHVYYQYLAKNRREVPSEPTEQPAPLKTQPEETVLQKLELMDVLKEMQKLPAQMREVIYLRICADLSFREIGEILGRSENWARVNFYRGKERLGKMQLEKAGKGAPPAGASKGDGADSDGARYGGGTNGNGTQHDSSAGGGAKHDSTNSNGTKHDSGAGGARYGGSTNGNSTRHDSNGRKTGGK